MLQINKDASAPHILNTSANLLGLCFIILTTIGLLHIKAKTYLDEATVIAMIMFMGSSIASFLSMKTLGRASQRFECFADIVFLIGLVILFLTALLISFNIISL